MFGLNFLRSVSGTTTYRRPLFYLATVCDFLVVGSGGSIGGGNGGGGYYSGGGGGGGMICSGQALQGGGGTAQAAFKAAVGVQFVCTVGGETSNNTQSYWGFAGSNSSLIGGGISFTAIGGGAGGGQINTLPAGSGGSGGGGAGGDNGYLSGGGAGTANQGYNGGVSGSNGALGASAGGGAGGTGGAGGNASSTGSYSYQVGGAGGLGLLWIDGNVYGYGGRGAQGAYAGAAQGAYAANRPAGGAANRGAGGQKSVEADASGGAGYGGAGVVIIMYDGRQLATGGTITTFGGKTVHTFTTTGTFEVTG